MRHRSHQALHPPTSLQLLGHPVRWRVVAQLARSDLRVRELMELVGQPQNLVSYHLGRLRACDLVTMRRSSADGRDAYYSLDLDRCADLLTTAGGDLHPALRPARPPAPTLVPPTHVLFLCTGNSARSQMAEALLDRAAGGAAEVYSAGSYPKPLAASAVRVMRRRGLDIQGRRSKHLSEFASHRFDYVITLCDRVREVCPEFPGHPRSIHWSIPDPRALRGTGRATDRAFEQTAVELESRIAHLLYALGRAQSHEEVH